MFCSWKAPFKVARAQQAFRCVSPRYIAENVQGNKSHPPRVAQKLGDIFCVRCCRPAGAPVSGFSQLLRIRLFFPPFVFGKSQKIHIKQKLVAHPHRSIASQLTGLFLACLLFTVVLKDFFYFFMRCNLKRCLRSENGTDGALMPSPPSCTLLLVASNKQNSGFICEDLLLKEKCLWTTSTNVEMEM